MDESDGVGASVVRRTLEIVNPRGLHARASRKLAELALRYDAQILVRREDGEADATSLMDLMMLGAGLGSEIEVSAQGPDREAAVEAIAVLVADGFGERD
ncbi:MAG: HPr family phosphocarrier protein [Hyphomonadaceae bacterium]